MQDIQVNMLTCDIVQGVGPQEYTLIKMKLKHPYPAKLQ